MHLFKTVADAMKAGPSSDADESGERELFIPRRHPIIHSADSAYDGESSDKEP